VHPLLALLLAAVPLAAGAEVRVGLEEVERERGGPLRGKRVGLVAHAASVTADGRDAIDVLRAQGVDLRRLFSPEHGLASRAPAGEKVPSGIDPATGLPLVSLYGEKTAPTPDDLRDLDALVVDLQDAGVRFYTYVSTMLLCLDAAAEARIELVVLDRPNPLGGERIEGPEREPGAVPESLVNMAPGPLVHGLTMGEMARFANGRRARPARLTVVTMRGWKREMTWADTARAWAPPSPNLRSAEAALAYPGVALLEATNVSEGRGTEAPFLLLGAPWLEAAELTGAVVETGFRLSVAAFTPRPSDAAPAPRFQGVECKGLRVTVTDTRAARPYALGIALLHALRRLQPEFRLRDEGAALDRLLGTRTVRRALEAGRSVGDILGQDAGAHARFRQERAEALLY
jgi:uncharacterized protein YbbC (DUF1343 family)